MWMDRLGFKDIIAWSKDILLFLFTGKAEGSLFEDDGDGYEFTKGGYLLTRYVAELQSSVVTVRVSKTEGLWKRPKRRLHVQLLLGGGAMVCLPFLEGRCCILTRH
jgi:hypothetical protein